MNQFKSYPEMERFIPMTEPWLSRWCTVHMLHMRLIALAELVENTPQERHYLKEALKVSEEKGRLFCASVDSLVPLRKQKAA